MVDGYSAKAFKLAYQKSGKFNLEVQAPSLQKLASKYFERYKRTKNWVDALKSHCLYNSVGFRKPGEEKWTKKAFKVQQEHLGADSKETLEYSQRVTSDLTQKLSECRILFRRQMEDVEILVSGLDVSSENSDCSNFVSEFGKKMEKISKCCTNRMTSICEHVFRFSVEMLADSPPCSFLVLALGSLARGEATPYSDLEYVFLIEKKNEEIEKYFEQLAMASYFIIGNLRETKLNNMAIDELNGWFDDRQKSGFRIDGLSQMAGNIPTGNGTCGKNRFIATAAELLSQYQNVLENPTEEESIRGDLTSLLQYTSPIFQYGTTATHLFQNFISQKQNASVRQCSKRTEANIKMLQADAKKYDFRPETHVIEHAYSINSKKELYRYPSILLFDLSILTGTCESDSWQALHSLVENKKISRSIYNSLTFLLACSCYVRLSTYLYHDSQDDRLSVLPKSVNPLDTVTSDAGKRWYLSKSVFLKICEHTIPLKEHISKCTTVDVLQLIKMDIKPSNWLTKFQSYFCCHRWVLAWEEFQTHFDEQDLLEHTEETINVLRVEGRDDLNFLWCTINAASYALFQQRKYPQGIKLHETLLQLNEKSAMFHEQDFQKIIAASIDEIALGSVYLDQHLEALRKYQISLDMRNIALPLNHELIAYSHCSIGRCLKQMKQHDEAEAHLVKALHIYNFHASREVVYDYYGDPVPHAETYQSLEHITCPDTLLQYLNNSSVRLGDVLWHLGTIYFAQKRYQRALYYLKKTELMQGEAYGCEAYHKNTACTYQSISYCYAKLGDIINASTYSRRAISVITHLYGEHFNDELNSAEARFLNGEIERAQYFDTALKIFLNLRGYKELHAETGGIVLYWGILFAHIELRELADTALETTIHIFTSISSSRLYQEEIAAAKSAQGFNSWKKGNTALAIKKFNEALAILKPIERPSAQLEAAETMQNMGLMRAEQKDFEVAKSHLIKAEQLYTQYCSDSGHPKLSEIKDQVNQVQLMNNRLKSFTSLQCLPSSSRK